MLKEAIQYLVSLKDNKTYTINGETYSDKDLVRIRPIVNRPSCLVTNSLDSIVQLVKKELSNFESVLPLYIQVETQNSVSVYTSYDLEMKRLQLYSAHCCVPGFSDGFLDYEKRIIELRSKFIQNEGSAYLLDLLSKISKENGVQTTDNGVSQSVEARTGVSLKTMVAIKPRVPLKPYRTFLEVDQPESEFLVRIDNDGNIGLFEADGGMWTIEAKSNIANYFHDELKDFIEAGKVVVMI